MLACRRAVCAGSAGVLTRAVGSAQGFDEDTGRVVLKMQGACSGCPSSAVRCAAACRGICQGC